MFIGLLIWLVCYVPWLVLWVFGCGLFDFGCLWLPCGFGLVTVFLGFVVAFDSSCCWVSGFVYFGV